MTSYKEKDSNLSILGWRETKFLITMWDVLLTKIKPKNKAKINKLKYFSLQSVNDKKN